MSNDTKPHLHVEFFSQAEHNKRLSAEQGRPIFEDKEFVKIRFVGDKHNVLVAPANGYGSIRSADTNERLTYAEQFPQHYAAFKANSKMLGHGTPLDVLNIPPSKIAELAAFNIYSVEAMATLDGTNLQRLGMGARDLKTKAEAFLAKAGNTAETVKLSRENEELRERLAALEARISGFDEPVKTSTSPFADWDADTIRLWIEEQGGDKPHTNCTLDTLIKKADALNADIEAKKKAA